MIDPVPLYRLANWLYRCRIPRLPRIVQHLNHFITGCLIPPQVKMGRRPIFQDCGLGVVINACTTIGDDVLILPQVVIGQNVRRGGKAVPAQIVIGNGVVLGAGAKIIASGYLEIGDGAAVGANAVVLKSVPPGCLAVGVPARIILPKEDQGIVTSDSNEGIMNGDYI